MQAGIEEKSEVIEEILLTDEDNFSREAIMHFQNHHIWADENPHGVIENRHQHQFSIIII